MLTPNVLAETVSGTTVEVTILPERASKPTPGTPGNSLIAIFRHLSQPGSPLFRQVLPEYIRRTAQMLFWLHFAR